MRLHLSPSIIARPLRNLGYTPGRDVELPYTVHMDPTDYPLGTTIVAGTLVIAQDFGSQALTTRQITTVPSAAGQITDDGGTDGVAVLFFFVDAATITAYRSLGSIVFEVSLTDSRGYQATLDSGALVPAPSTATEPVASITVAPSTVGLDVGQTQQLTVTAYDINHNVLPGRTVTYQSSASSNASVSPTGLVTGVASGAALITATCEGKTGTCLATVTAVDHVTIAPSPLTIAKFGTQQFTGTAFDSGNVQLNNRVFTWASSDPATASIDANGLLTAHLGGSVTITGTSEGKSATSSVTVTVTIDQMTPPEFITAFNALGAGGVGATFRGLFLRGVNQIVYPNGDSHLPSPGTNSPTGYWLLQWDDAVNPGQGKHKRPSAGVNGGNGAPCVPVNPANLALGGREAGQGLEWPASTGYSAGAQETISRSVILPNSGGLSNVLTDHTAGFMLFAFGNMKNGTYPFYVGEVGDAAKTYYSGDFGFGKEALVDPASGYIDGLFSTTPTKQLMAMWCGTIIGRGAPGTLWSQDWYYVGRDFVWYDSAINVNDGTYGPTPGANITGNAAATRRIRTNLNGGNTADQYGAHDCEGALAGRWTAPQHKLLCDWAEFQTWGAGIWNDTRSHITNYLGDSLFIENDRNLSRGSNGAPAIPSHTIVFLAQSGDFLEQRLYHLVEIFRDMDYSKRAATAGVCICAAGEWVNDIVSDGNPTNCVTRNYFQGDAFRALDPNRVRVIMSGETYSGATTLTNGQTMLNILLSGGSGLSAAVPNHADVYLDFVSLLPFTAYHFQDGVPAHQIPVFFDGSSHWTALAEEYLEAPVRNAILAAIGIDDSTRSNDVVPSVTNATLTAGSPTITPTWAVKNRVRSTLGGKTITLTSLDPSIATVNNSTGLVTRVAVGRARIKAVTDDGALGIFVADCT